MRKLNVMLTPFDLIYNALRGTNTTDRINGLGGNDVIYGNDGNDTLNGGAGNDKLRRRSAANDDAWRAAA